MKRRNFIGIAVTALAALVGLKVDLRSEFDRWCDDVDRIFMEKCDIDFSLTKDTGREHWRDMFDDGTSPEDAVWEEMSNWDPC